MAVAIGRPHAAKRRVEGFLLLRVRQFSDQECVADGNYVFEERLGHGWNQVRQLDASLHISLAFARSGRDAGDGVGRFSELQERLETERLFKWVDVLALQVFDYLGLYGLRIRQFDNADGDGLKFRQFRRS